MKELTPWFNAKLHSPTREGWYDCKECKKRHYFKDDLWYRDRKSLRDGPMTINKMHWRGLAADPLPIYPSDDGPLSAKQITALRKDAEQHLPKGKTIKLASLLARYDPNAPKSAVEVAAENMVPVGAEFGSPDYERLLRESIEDLKNGKLVPYKFGQSQR